MANIAISELDTESTQLKDSDYILISSKNDNGSFTSAKLTGKKLKDSILTFDDIYPVGSIYLSINSSLPNGFIGTWVRIASGKCLWGCDNNGGDVNTIINAGLPNITGSFSTVDAGAIELPDGSFCKMGDDKTTSKKTDDVPKESVDAFHDYLVNFKASDSNSIYGSSLTVQPPALVVSMWRRAS